MKSIAVLLFSLSFACTSLAQEYASRQKTMKVIFHESAPIKYDDGQIMVKNEILRVLFCCITGTLTEGEIPFTFDKSGQIMPDTKVTYYSWGGFPQWDSETSSTYYVNYLPMSLDADGKSLGIPITTSTNNKVDERIIDPTSRILASDATALNGKSLYLFLILMDTREPICVNNVWQETLAVPTEKAEPTHVTAWSATHIATITYNAMAYNKDISIGYAADGYVPKYLNTMNTTTPVRKFTIDNTLVDATDGENDIADQAIIDTYLSPSVNSFVADADGNYTLTATTTEDLIPYTLQTRESLSSGEWQDIDTWKAAVEAYNNGLNQETESAKKKVLANDTLPCYNRLRIGQGSSIPLPRVLGEPTRFYRLKSE